MAFTLWNLFEATILCLNAICILNEERFLTKFGWGYRNRKAQGFDEGSSTRDQIINLMHSIRTVAKVPLIPLNVLVIVVKLILG